MAGRLVPPAAWVAPWGAGQVGTAARVWLIVAGVAAVPAGLIAFTLTVG
jgi:hypothetical protein